jgi:hypothetical protein
MWKLEERRVDDEFDKVTPEEHREIRAGEDFTAVRMYRTEFARCEEDADEPEKLGTLAVVWELIEAPCECESEPDEPDDCVCDRLESALATVLADWDVFPTSEWEPSSVPWDAADENLWVSAHENYEFESCTRFDYSLHFEGITPEVRGEFMAALGVR